MNIKYITIAFVLLAMLFTKEIKADAVNDNRTVTLQEYINSNCKANCVTAEEVKKYTQQIAEKYNIDPKILISIMRVESSFKKKAFNTESYGLMQVNAIYHWAKFKGKSFFDVRSNIDAGGSIYKNCLTRSSNSISKALRCYNGLVKTKKDRYTPKVDKAYMEISSLVDM